MSGRIASLFPELHRLPEGFTDDLPTPTLVVFMDHVRSNVDGVIGHLGGDADRWRPHLKTTKMPIVWAALLDAGIRSFKCATVREAAVLVNLLNERGVAGADLLVAYPHRGPSLKRLAEIAFANRDTAISIICEDAGLVASIPAVVGVFVDVDPGMKRTGIALEDRETIAAVAREAGPRFRGVHFYDGHVRAPLAADRAHQAHALYGRLLELVAFLQTHGIEVGEIVTSGTLTLLEAACCEPLRNGNGTIHRVSAGTVVFHDAGYDEMAPDLGLTPAAVLLSRIISAPGRNLVTADAGSKSIAAEAGDPCAVALGFPGLHALKPSEEHLPFEVRSGEGPSRGETLLLVPRHVCPTVNLAEQAAIIEGGRFRGFAPVSARGHDSRP